MEPSSTDLRYFLEIARSGSISSAAAKLGVTQPSLSLALRRIESSLNEKVVIRGRNGATLTKAGQTLLQETRSMIESWESIRRKVSATNSEMAGAFVLGCHPDIAVDSLPLFVPALLKRHPKLEFILKHDQSVQIARDVVHSEVDIGIVVNAPAHPDLIVRTLAVNTLSFWTGPGRTTAGVLVHDLDQVHGQRLIQRARSSGVKFDREMHSSDLEVIAHLVSSGAGVGLLPDEVALRNPSLKLRRMPGTPEHQEKISLIYRKESRQVAAVRLIVEEAQKSHALKYGRFQNPAHAPAT